MSSLDLFFFFSFFFFLAPAPSLSWSFFLCFFFSRRSSSVLSSPAGVSPPRCFFFLCFFFSLAGTWFSSDLYCSGRGPGWSLEISELELLDIARISSQVLPEAGQLKLVEKHQLLPAHRRVLNQLPQTGVVLGGAGVDDAGQSRQEAGEIVLHLLCWRRGESVWREY